MGANLPITEFTLTGTKLSVAISQIFADITYLAHNDT